MRPLVFVFILWLSACSGAVLLQPLASQWPDMEAQARQTQIEDAFVTLERLAKRSEVAEIQGLLGDTENLLALIRDPQAAIEVEPFEPTLKAGYSIGEIASALALKNQYQMRQYRLGNELSLLTKNLEESQAAIVTTPQEGSSVAATISQLTYLKNNVLHIWQQQKQQRIQQALADLTREQTALAAWLDNDEWQVVPSAAELQAAQEELPVSSTPSNLMSLVSIIGVTGEQLMNNERAVNALRQQLVALFEVPDDDRYRQLRITYEQRYALVEERRRLIQQAIEANSERNDESAISVLLAARKHISEQVSRLALIDYLLTRYPFQFQTLAERQVGELVAASQLSWQSIAQFVEGILALKLFTLNDKPLTIGGLAWLVVMLVGAWLLHRTAKRALYRYAAHSDSFSESSVFTIDRLLFYTLMTTAIFISLSVLGIDLTKLALVAGALSVGIGFGLQSIFSNFVSGLILLFERPVKVGDLIELESGVLGKVKAINVRSTQVTTPDNIDVLVPNSEFVNGRVTNFTFDDPQRRLRIKFGVAYGTNKEALRKLIIDVALALPYTVTTPMRSPDLWLVNLADSALEFELVVWVDVRNMPATKGITALYLWHIESALREANISIPFPQREVRLYDK